MAVERKQLSVAELDQMSPNERAKAVRERLVTEPDDLPEDFRRRVFDTARRLASQRTKGR